MFRCPIWYLVDRDTWDTGSSHADCVLTRKNAKTTRRSWTRSTRRSCAAELDFKQDHRTRVEGAVIVLEAKNMTIDFGRDAGHCVTYTSSSSVKSEATTQRIQ